jgi:predicted dehydrogenase
MKSRRTFIKQSGLVLAGISLSHSALSYSRILGSNNRIRVGVVGLNSRGSVLTDVLLQLNGFEIVAFCDVDTRTFDIQNAKLTAKQLPKAKTFRDFREMIAGDSVDAVVIATADHTHAPFAIYALNAGKHVYLEKPTCYCPAEGEKLIKTAKASSKKLQIGNQQRSSFITQEGIAMIHSGMIGQPYEARTWYTNQRTTIGKGFEAPVPDWLDWDLWQGPAPRRQYRSNIVHYNWHWFRHWGTGEICNNAVHEIDIALWAMKVQYPITVTSHGGRFHYTDDDWEFYDTQLATFDYPGNKRIIWDGRSCTNMQFFNRGRGTIIYGSNGSMMLDRNGYVQYDLQGKVVSERQEAVQVDATNVKAEDHLTYLHMLNWHRAITQNEKLNAPVEEANVSNLLCHIGNMAQDLQRPLKVNTETGRVKDGKAMKKWDREYEKGWEI